MLKIGVNVHKSVEIYYEGHGTGRPVVLIHVWPLGGQSWEAQVLALVDAGYRVVTYDHRGFGASSQPRNGYDYDIFSADLQGLMTHLDLKDATLVELSAGGGEVARYIGTYGTERIAKAVFTGAIPPHLHKILEQAEGGLDDATIQFVQDSIKKDRMVLLNTLTTNFFTAGGKMVVSEARRVYARDMAAFASPKGTLNCIAAFATTDFRADLAKCTLPTLVIHGESDGIVPLKVSGARTREAIPGSQLHVVKEALHGFNLSHAAEFNQVLLNFLAE